MTLMPTDSSLGQDLPNVKVKSFIWTAKLEAVIF